MNWGVVRDGLNSGETVTGFSSVTPAPLHAHVETELLWKPRIVWFAWFSAISLLNVAENALTLLASKKQERNKDKGYTKGQARNFQVCV